MTFVGVFSRLKSISTYQLTFVFAALDELWIENSYKPLSKFIVKYIKYSMQCLESLTSFLLDEYGFLECQLQYVVAMNRNIGFLDPDIDICVIQIQWLKYLE